MPSQPFHLLPTHGALSLTPSLLFIRPRINQRPRPRPKAQYIILGPCPYKWKEKYLYVFTFVLLKAIIVYFFKAR